MNVNVTQIKFSSELRTERRMAALPFPGDVYAKYIVYVLSTKANVSPKSSFTLSAVSRCAMKVMHLVDGVQVCDRFQRVLLKTRAETYVSAV